MRVLVTGGLGFVGRAVVQRLLEREDAVDVLTSSAPPPPEAGPDPQAGPDPEAGLDSGARPDSGSRREFGLVRADLRDRDALGRVVAAGGYEGVVHLAGVTRVRDSLADPVRYFDVNLTGTLNLLHALDVAALATGRPARLVFASTAAVYGAQEGTLDEDRPTQPVNPYGASKLAAEQLIGYQTALGRLGAISLRCFNVAGVPAGHGDRDLTRMIPKTLAVAAGVVDVLEINGDGGAVREYTHVLDVAAAVGLALDAADVGKHRVYNLGTGQGISVAEVVEAARRLTGRPIRVEHHPARPEARILIADPRRIRHELGWIPVNSSLPRILGDSWAAVLAGR